VCGSTVSGAATACAMTVAMPEANIEHAVARGLLGPRILRSAQTLKVSDREVLEKGVGFD
jgi:hypothetical protein